MRLLLYPILALILVAANCPGTDLIGKVQSCPKEGLTVPCTKGEAKAYCGAPTQKNCVKGSHNELTWSSCQPVNLLAPKVGDVCDTGKVGACIKGTIDCKKNEPGTNCISSQPPIPMGQNQCALNCDGTPVSGPMSWDGKYDGPSGTEYVGICRPERCHCDPLLGQAKCDAEVTPKPRDCTSSDDNDCNGVPDNQEVGSAQIDYVFFIEVVDQIDMIVKSITKFAIMNYGNPGIRMAIVTMAYPRDNTCNLLSDFQDPMGAVTAFTRAGLVSLDGELIPSYDCVYAALRPDVVAPVFPGAGADNLLTNHLSFRPGARKVFILFMDEIPQVGTDLIPANHPTPSMPTMGLSKNG